MQIFQLRVSNKQFLDIIDKLNLSIPNLVDDPLLESDEMADSDYEKYLELARVNIYLCEQELIDCAEKGVIGFSYKKKEKGDETRMVVRFNEENRNTIHNFLLEWTGPDGSHTDCVFQFEHNIAVTVNFFERWLNFMHDNNINKDQIIQTYYNRYYYTPIELLSDVFPKEAFCGYCVGSIIEYVSRWKEEGGVVDLQKARLLLLKNKANLSFIEDSQAASSCEKFLSQLDEKEANIIESILNGYHEKAIKVLNELILEKGGTIDE